MGVFSEPFNNNHFAISLYKTISPSHHFTFLPFSHYSTAKGQKKAALEQQFIGLFVSDASDSEEYVCEKNASMKDVEE